MKFVIDESSIITYPLGAEEYVLFNTVSEELLVLNEQAFELWEKVVAGDDVHQFVDDSGFPTECNELLEKLLQKKFIMVYKNA